MKNYNTFVVLKKVDDNWEKLKNLIMFYDEVLKPFASEDVPVDDEEVEDTETPAEEETSEENTDENEEI